MGIQTIFDMCFNLLGGLFIFLLGMRYMSDGMQTLAGAKMRKMIGKVTDNRFTACLTGASVTCLIQSSSVTAVMAISMVNAGLMTLRQSIGILLGADIGTTITA
jgi:phosphate:Na+ symporter